MRIFRLFYTNFVSKKRKPFLAGFPFFCIFILFFSTGFILKNGCLPPDDNFFVSYTTRMVHPTTRHPKELETGSPTTGSRSWSVRSPSIQILPRPYPIRYIRNTSPLNFFFSETRKEKAGHPHSINFHIKRWDAPEYTRRRLPSPHDPTFSV